ncbi:hypothetical protein AAZX31_17G108600 [Glycine max]
MCFGLKPWLATSDLSTNMLNNCPLNLLVSWICTCWYNKGRERFPSPPKEMNWLCKCSFNNYNKDT